MDLEGIASALSASRFWWGWKLEGKRQVCFTIEVFNDFLKWITARYGTRIPQCSYARQRDKNLNLNSCMQHQILYVLKHINQRYCKLWLNARSIQAICDYDIKCMLHVTLLLDIRMTWLYYLVVIRIHNWVKLPLSRWKSTAKCDTFIFICPWRTKDR